MPGQYLTRGAVRPRLCGKAEEPDASARLYLCARCQAQVLICSCCDRGNIYCARECAEVVRRSAQREASKRYQATDRGRRNHAERARKYRAQKKVTHQGSPLQRTDDLVSEGWAITPSTLRPRRSLPHVPREAPLRCHWCGCRCSPFVRRTEPVTPIVTHRLPSDQWRHFEKLKNPPAAFITIGDGIC